VYKLRKALYVLKQVPRAWYGRLRGFLFERGFEMGKVNQTIMVLHYAGIAPASLGQMHGARDGGDGGEGGRRSTVGIGLGF
jgi:hypothetical protein